MPGFKQLIDAAFDLFAHELKNGMGWRLARNDNGCGRRESAVHDLFETVCKVPLDDVGIVLSRECKVGRGEPDFRLSRTSREQALVEFKLARNPDLSSAPAQLTTYSQATGISLLYLPAVCFEPEELKKAKRLHAANRRGPVRILVIDATKPLPASRVR